MEYGPGWRRRVEWARAWRRARGPFALPWRLAGHECGGHWDVLDVDLAGCRLCGRAHFCSARPADVEAVRAPYNSTPGRARRENVDCACETVQCEGHSVCAITGYCTRETRFADDEYVDTATLPPEPAPREVTPLEEGEVRRYVDALLCSERSRRCFEHENTRVDAKVSAVFLHLLREFKTEHPARAPDACRLVGELARRTLNVRVCPPGFDAEYRAEIAAAAARAISGLVHTATRLCPALLSQTRRQTLVVGLLYLMRSGLTVHDTCLLPRLAALQELLPLESYLPQHFEIKCKSITEVENLVKMQLRVLTSRETARLGVGAVASRCRAGGVSEGRRG